MSSWPIFYITQEPQLRQAPTIVAWPEGKAYSLSAQARNLLEEPIVLVFRPNFLLLV